MALETLKGLPQKCWFKCIVAIAILLIFIALLGVFFFYVLENENGQISQASHLTFKDTSSSEFHESSNAPYSVWKNSIDELVNPCDNFYAFTCGNYKLHRQKEIDEEKEKVNDIVSKVLKDFKTPSSKEESEPQIKECLKNALFGNKPSNSSAVGKMRYFRDSIHKGREGRTKEQMVDQLKLVGGCPAILGKENFDENFEVVDALYYLKKFTGKSSLFTTYAAETFNGSFVFGIKPDNLTLPKYSGQLDLEGIVKYNFVSEQKLFFAELFDRTAQQLDLSIDFNELANKLARLDYNVFQIMADGGLYNKRETEEDDDSLYDEIRFEDLNDLLTITNGTDYFMKIVEHMPDFLDYLKTNPIIYLRNLKTLELLDAFYANENKELMANYLCSIYLVQHHILDRLQKTDDNSNEQEVATFKEDIDETQPEAAVRTLQTLFGFVTDHLFINECIDAKDLKIVARMVDEIQEASLKMIESQDWLDPLTKSRMLQKLRSMKKYIGALDFALDMEKLDKNYRHLHFAPEENLHDMFAKIFFFIEANFFNDVLTQEKVYDIYRANEINSVNLLRRNAIVIHAGSFYSPNFDSKRPEPLNYGALGMEIGHESWHSFNFRSDSVERNDLWTPRSYEKFQERAQCIVDQFDKLENVESYGTKTLIENLADIIGLKAAYNAHKQNFVGNEKANVRGFENYTNDQAFFIGYGTIWCINHLSLTQKLLTDVDEHALNKYRVNEPLKNMVEFANAFNCTLGSKMNPVKKCEIF